MRTAGTLTNGKAYAIRPYEPSDRDAVLALKERHDPLGVLWFADPDDPVNFETYLIEVDGQLVATFTGRTTIEGFMMLDKFSHNPKTRLEVAAIVTEVARERANELQVPEVHMFAMPFMKKWFNRLLKMRGVWKDDRYHAILGRS